MRSGGKLTLAFLVLWCRSSAITKGFADEAASEQELLEEVEFELKVTGEQLSWVAAHGAMEEGEQVADVDAEQMHLAEQLAMPEKSWPAVSSKPSRFEESGKLSRCFPLALPMGIADMWDERDIDVAPHEWVQHELRKAAGLSLHGAREHREVWAYVNTVLLTELAVRAGLCSGT